MELPPEELSDVEDEEEDVPSVPVSDEVLL